MLQIDKIREKEEEGKAYATINKLVRRFRSIYQTTQPVASSIGTFATLGVAEETAKATAQAKTPTKKLYKRKKQDYTCLYRQKHLFKDCPYVVHSRRPSS
jgi:hypothetical protein